MTYPYFQWFKTPWHSCDIIVMNQPVNIETTMKNVIKETAWDHNNL